MANTKANKFRPLEILMVDDDPADVRLVQEALKESKMEGGRPASRLHVAQDGDDALAFLRREGKHKKAARADIVLLDLNMPRKDGFATLREIRADPDLTSTPIVVLTTSNADKDVQQSYKLHANAFVTKPTDLDQFVAVVHEVEQFWLETAVLPTMA